MKHHTTLLKKMNIAEHLKPLLNRVLDKDGKPTLFFEYVEGQDDGTVARVFKCNRGHVRYVRTALFGRLKPRSGNMPPVAVLHDRMTQLLGRIDALDQRIADLEKWASTELGYKPSLAALETKLNKIFLEPATPKALSAMAR